MIDFLTDFLSTINGTFEEVAGNVKSVLKEQGFGVITEIDMDAKLKEKLDDIAAKVNDTFIAALQKL